MPNSSNQPIRVRIAPSPTGNLHIGTARTALFNWLFARHHGGQFILRIEDTDLERSEKKYEEDIIAGLKWLGLAWDEGPYRQSERLDIYERHLRQILESGHAYYCACSKEELEQERTEQMRQKLAPHYSGKCRDRGVSEKEGHIIRFRMPEETISFTDEIRGEIAFDTSLMGDVAIAKNLRTPLYNFAVVVDDHEMHISHVIRGEDHIANTPKQIAIQRALGIAAPRYAHLPLILDPDRSKMSKRYSATSIQEYRRLGYLPEALFNFTALLGWHPQDDQEILNSEKLVELFALERVQKAGAVFDIKKLNWLNSHYIREAPLQQIKDALTDIFGAEMAQQPLTEKLIAVSRERLERLGDFQSLNNFFFQLPDYEASLLAWKKSTLENAKINLEKVLEILGQCSDFSQTSLESVLMPFAEQAGRGEVLWPLRAALSGQENSPGPFEIISVLGKEETLARIQTALGKLVGN